VEIWISDGDGGNLIQVTRGAVGPAAPRWSPDGRQLTNNPASDATAYWSRDAKSIYFASSRTGRNEVWKIPADGTGPEVQITRNSGWRSRESIDGKWLYFQKWDAPGIWRIPVSGGEEELIGDMPTGTTWDLANGAAYFYRQRFLHRIDLATRTASVPVPLPPRTLGGGTLNFSVSPDGRWLAFVRGEQVVSDLMLVNNFR